MLLAVIEFMPVSEFIFIFKSNPCFMCNYFRNMWRDHTDKKRKSNFPYSIYKKIQNGAVAKS
jgi:hypothetical protein